MQSITILFTSKEGSNKRLVQYAVAYPFFYAIFLFWIAYYLKVVKMDGFEHLLNNTLGAMFVCLIVPLVFAWRKRFTSKGNITIAGFTFPREWLWLFPSGICTAVVIPTTTLMYGLLDPVTHERLPVTVAQPLMRAGLILTTILFVDLVQILLGISKKKLVWQEIVAAAFAFGTVWFAARAGGPKGFNFINSKEALVIMGMYIGFYTIRQYIMSHYKNTQGSYDLKGFFVVEQAFAAATVLVASIVIIGWPELFGWEQNSRILAMRSVFLLNPSGNHGPDFGAILSGLPYGVAAFFSVFLFMFPGKNQTFAVLTNRLASLAAAPLGTACFIWLFAAVLVARGDKSPTMKAEDLQSLWFVVIALGFMAWGEWSRAKAKRLAAAQGDATA
ncbi:hypothetical protein HYW17_00655 [Candidatus Uhrbacteria bacterium]|nr:hypothetical protein [Candidatus Uhrbacteria bacterium]